MKFVAGVLGLAYGLIALGIAAEVIVIHLIKVVL